MSNWTPDLAGLTGPRYRAIADALARDIAAGRLQPGFRLPTHRDLAWNLKVTVGTITRAYAEAERRGLIGGQVGRGTFVLQRTEAQSPAPALNTPDDGIIDMAVNVPVGGHEGDYLRDCLSRLAASPHLDRLMGYQPNLGLAEHRATMAEFAKLNRVPATADRTIVTAGGQHGALLVLSHLARPGEVIACEGLTYGGIKAAARFMNLRIKGIPLDEGGPIPDAFAFACREGGIKAFYCVPTLHNPTGIIWSLERRRAILDIAARYQVPILEDDVYTFLAPDAPPPLAALAPDQVYHISSTSKNLAPSLRVGALVTPQAVTQDFVAGLRATTWMAPPLMVEIVRLWLNDGTVGRLVEEKTAAGAARNARARALFAAAGIALPPGHTNAFHLWLPLPDPWRDDAFADAARRAGVLVSPGWSFAIGKRNGEAVRISLGGARDLDAITTAITRLTGLLHHGPAEDPGIL